MCTFLQSQLFSPCHHEGGKNLPISQNDLPRPAGFASFMRLPMSSLQVRLNQTITNQKCKKSEKKSHQETASLDACIVGVPVDGATSNRPGTRFGPRQIRTESAMVRPRYPQLPCATEPCAWTNHEYPCRSHWTGENPFHRLQVTCPSMAGAPGRRRRGRPGQPLQPGRDGRRGDGAVQPDIQVGLSRLPPYSVTATTVFRSPWVETTSSPTLYSGALVCLV